MAASSGGKSKTDSSKNNENVAQVNNKPIKSMKLFTEWDIENAAPNCMPRSCCLRVVRLQVFRALEPELKAMVICVSMQGSRRSLRSDQIPVPATGVLDVEVDLVFTLQYPHFLKRRENKLQVTLQRRKKYKTRTILGYKTLAIGNINMGQVLQGWYSLQLDVFVKDDPHTPAATITLSSLSSDPIDREIHRPIERRRTIASVNGNIQLSSDEEPDDESYSSDVDSAGEIDNARETYNRHSARRQKMSARNNIKQKILQALFKKLKATEGGYNDVQKDLELNDVDIDGEFLFDDDDDDDDEDDDDDVEFDNHSDLLADNTSIASIQKPGLRPYFDHSRSQTKLNQNTLTREDAQRLSAAFKTVEKTDNTDHHSDEPGGGEQESRNDSLASKTEETTLDTQSSATSVLQLKPGARSISFKEKRSSGVKGLKRKGSCDLDMYFKEKVGFNDQLTAVISNDDKIPEYVLMIGIKDDVGQHLALKLMARLGSVVCTSCSEDVQATIGAVCSKFQKFSNRHSVAPLSMKIGIIGPESYLRCVVKSYVEQFSLKPQEYQTYLKFLIIPSGPHKVASYIAHLDQRYQSLFMDSFWKTVFDHDFLSENDLREVEKRILQYVDNADSYHALPIAEALVTLKVSDGESSQTFIPFITEVRMGSADVCNTSEVIDNESGFSFSTNAIKEVTNGNHEKLNAKESLSSSPRSDILDTRPAPSHTLGAETLDLIVDYWPISLQSKKEDRKDNNKLTIKTGFRSLCVSRLPSNENEDITGLLFSASTKNKNKGVKRLMKQRDKDSEAKSSVTTVVNKIVCTTRSSGQTFSVLVDGREINGVKFFSLSSQWPTHIKQFPIGMFLNYGVDKT